MYLGLITDLITQQPLGVVVDTSPDKGCPARAVPCRSTCQKLPIVLLKLPIIPQRLTHVLWNLPGATLSVIKSDCYSPIHPNRNNADGNMSAVLGYLTDPTPSSHESLNFLVDTHLSLLTAIQNHVSSHPSDYIFFLHDCLSL